MKLAFKSKTKLNACLKKAATNLSSKPINILCIFKSILILAAVCATVWFPTQDIRIPAWTCSQMPNPSKCSCHLHLFKMFSSSRSCVVHAMPFHARGYYYIFAQSISFQGWRENVVQHHRYRHRWCFALQGDLCHVSPVNLSRKYVCTFGVCLSWR